MSEPIRLTDDLLLEAGGWKEMKEARRIHRSGLIDAATYEDGVLEGTVRDRGGAYRARLKIDSRTDMENLCTCPRARRDGIICAHVLAAGLEFIHPQEKETPAPDGGSAAREKRGAATATKPAPPGRPAGAADAWPSVTEAATESARPAECHVILAPKFASAWEKGRIMVGIEVEVDGERRLLGAIPGDTVLFLDPHDVPVIAALKQITPGEVPGMMTVGREDFLRLLDSLAGHPRVTFGKNTPARISIAPFRPALDARDLRIRVQWPRDDVTPLIGEAGAWVLRGEVFHPVAPGLPAEMRSVFDSGFTMEASRARKTIRSLEDVFAVPAGLAEELPEPVVPEVLLDLEGSLNHLEAKFTFDYGDAGSTAMTNPAVEQAAAEALARWGFAGPDRAGKLVLKDRPGILRFHAHGFPSLDPAWKISTGERFEHAAKQVSPVKAAFDFRGAGEDWFDVSLEFETAGGEAFSRREIQRLLQTGQNHAQLRDGSFAVIDAEGIEELRETIADCDPGQEQPGTFRIDQRFGGFLHETVVERGVTCAGTAPWSGESAREREDRPLGALEEILRPYQREGVEWMRALAGGKMGGILADDMGLGKTVQALAFLKASGAKRALVVCPSSLVFNWVAEAERFVPEMNAVAIDGPGRGKKLAAANSGDVVLVTSYALLRRDEETWRAMEFDAVILDEAQQIKNPDSQVAKAACRLRARHRFALTGTPIENSVRDLWSVMHFVMPGYLGARKWFAERFEKPIAKGNGGAPELERRLRRRLKPVVLRRLKGEVARDLPEKIEQTIYCELNAKQKEVYGALLRESRATILDAEGNRKRMLALTALLRLRQACCDLRLLGLEGIEPAEASAKLDAVEELLDEAVAGGHRVLIFSQFVEMLQVFVLRLHEKDLAYCYLDGQTKDRAEVVNRFQGDSAIPVFLISLKAGGVGLNLTGADTVIHVDPWWNPAIEAQATDRAHRIGQERAVTSYKLIARDTVEEKILALQAKKRETIRAVMDAGEALAGSPAESSSISEAEIYELLG